MNNPFGVVGQPAAVQNLGSISDGGPGKLIQTFIWLLIAGAGIYALFNFILAGYSFLGAGSDAKKVQDAWKKIWQSVLGLAVAAGAITIAALIGKLIFGEFDFLLNPQIPNI